MEAIHAGVLGNSLPAEWRDHLKAVNLVPLDAERSIPDGIDVVLVDGKYDFAVHDLRSLRPKLPHAQPIIITVPERRAFLQRSVMLSPGLGEVWIVTPEELRMPLLTRAAEIGTQRRRHAAQQKRREPRLPHAPTIRRPVVTDAFLATVLQVAHVAVFALDGQGTVMAINPAAERLFDLQADTALGKHIFDVVHPADRAAADLLLASENDDLPELVFKLPGGSTRTFEMDIATVPNRPEGLRVLVAHDVTELVRQHELLEQQAAEMEYQTEQVSEQAAELEQLLETRDAALADVERLMESRSRFYASMNHEIRTPINAILGYNDLMLAGIYGELSKDIHTSVERSQRAARHLLELVNDVLDLSKIEAGRLDLDLQQHNLPDLIRDLVQTIQPLILESGSTIECDLNCEAPVYTDGRRVRQIIMNLLSNAAKFGQGKPITIRCTISDGHARVDVVDQGIGIPKEQLPMIFEEFFQLRERRQRGTGLGLAISKRLADMLGGRMAVQSTVGAGSTFSLILPMTPLTVNR
jgi:PAS domain S-box-containing protein